MKGLPRAAIDPRVFDDYAGRYAFEDNDAPVTIARDGKRLLWVEGETRIELVPQSETVFRARELPVPIRFVRDGQRRVTHVLWEVAEIRIVRQPSEATSRR